MLTIEQIRNKASTLSPVAIEKHNYRKIAAIIYPFTWIDVSISQDTLSNLLNLADELPEFKEYRRHQQTIAAGSWMNCLVNCVLMWQYNAALIKLFPDLEEWKLE